MSTLSAAQRRHVVAETAVNAVVNSAISALFVWLVFRGMSAIPLLGSPGLAIDLVPTCIAITLVSTLVLTLRTRSSLRRGKVEGTSFRGTPAWLPRNVLLRAIVAAIGVTAVAVPATTLMLKLLGVESFSYAQVMVFKVIFGAVLSLAISPLLVRLALGDHEEGHR